MDDIRQIVNSLNEEEQYDLELASLKRKKRQAKILKDGRLSGKAQKQSGKSFEYRTAGYICRFNNWWAKRVPSDLGRHSLVFGKHDVVAKYKDIRYDFECKKSTTDVHEISVKQQWLDKIDFITHKEALCISFKKSIIYCVLPVDVYEVIIEKKYKDFPKVIGKGNKQVLIKQENLKEDCLQFVLNNVTYIMFPFEEYLNQVSIKNEKHQP